MSTTNTTNSYGEGVYKFETSPKSRFGVILPPILFYLTKVILWLSTAVLLGLLLGWVISDKAPLEPIIQEVPIAVLPVVSKPVYKPNIRVYAACNEDVESTLSQKKFSFRSGSSKLSPKSRKLAQTLTNLILPCSTAKIEIDGHTDSMGEEVNNQRLSLLRAKSVAKEFQKQGISIDNIKVKGLGSTRPAESNDTRKGRAQNRRIEIRVYKNQ